MPGSLLQRTPMIVGNWAIMNPVALGVGCTPRQVSSDVVAVGFQGMISGLEMPGNRRLLNLKNRS
jgi:hypothetical protein